jgi:hypothetical protein
VGKRDSRERFVGKRECGKERLWERGTVGKRDCGKEGLWERGTVGKRACKKRAGVYISVQKRYLSPPLFW